MSNKLWNSLVLYLKLTLQVFKARRVFLNRAAVGRDNSDKKDGRECEPH